MTVQTMYQTFSKIDTETAFNLLQTVSKTIRKSGFHTTQGSQNKNCLHNVI